MIKKRLEITAVTGFARPACMIVSNASKFKSTISLNYKGVSVNLGNSPHSIMELMSLKIKPGTYVEITATGCDERAAIQTLVNSLIRNLYIEREKRGDSGTFSKKVCSSCYEAVFMDEASRS
ncbi:HPr family phosphocarrier protein [Peribacillus deserti]|uniref:HPr family phosphocarrier protein n=1 Tax=Peribacillus deserti TaxID=673318 RepID=A0A2N5M2Y0_9BACI|nr:HPr family phosphocarrier protein [Peribacillus deserti]PLT28685.1 HPr family phosphocarrier protein [Peribacillus deserti]